MYVYTDSELMPHYTFYAQWEEAYTVVAPVVGPATIVTLFQDGSVSYGRWIGVECIFDSANTIYPGVVNYFTLEDRYWRTNVLTNVYDTTKNVYGGNGMIASCETGTTTAFAKITIQKETDKYDYNSDGSRRFENESSIRVSHMKSYATPGTFEWTSTIMNI